MNISCVMSNDARESNTEMHKSWVHIWCRLAKVMHETTEERKKNCYETSLKQTTDHTITLVAQIKRHTHMSTIDWKYMHIEQDL